MDFKALSNIQNQTLLSGELHSISSRKVHLKRLKTTIQEHENEILVALKADMGKGEFEAYSSEIGFVYQEITDALKNLHKWAKPKRVFPSVSLFPSSAKIVNQPFGKTLIISPWNYPFQLLLAPLVAAIAAGNTALLKPSELTPNTSAILVKIIEKCFKPEIVSIIEGDGRTLIPQIIEDYRPNLIFFTGSTQVGKIISQQAANYLIPGILELGGKSPCIIHKDANLEVAAKRIALGKFLNSGQTCVAPDYLVVHEDIQEKFLTIFQRVIQEFYYNNQHPFDSSDYTQIVNPFHFNRLLKLLEGVSVVFGGRSDEAKRKIEPTVVKADISQPIMQEEIFGPILPIFTYNRIEEIDSIISHHPNPLSFYVFSEDNQFTEELTSRHSFGGGCINNTVMHLVDPQLPFGGIGYSGSGAYHGKWGFDAFSHKKSIVKTASWFDLKQKYPPYTSGSLKIIKWFLK
jgi:aldehyde dehydrogenase (NAD+)